MHNEIYLHISIDRKLKQSQREVIQKFRQLHLSQQSESLDFPRWHDAIYLSYSKVSQSFKK